MDKVHEILEAAAKAPNREEKIKVLQDNNCLALRNVLKGAYDDSIQWDLPKGDVPLEDDEIPETPTMNLKDKSNMLGMCVNNKQNREIPAYKKEGNFLKLYKNIDRKDAELLIKMKDKKLAGVYKGVTKTLVQKAFPNLISQ